MSRLEELIAELCPDGVEFHQMGKVCRLVTGATPSKTNPAFWIDGTIPWMSSGEVNNKRVFDTESKITKLGYDKTSTTIVPIHTVVIALAGQGKTRGKVAITEIELCTNQSLCSIICGPELDYKFLYYYLDGKYEELRTISNGDGTRGGLSLKILSPYKIPVPPLPVQSEIVKILDNFTELTAQLQEQLILELSARRKQYEYYRDKLLTFDVLEGGASDAVWRTLADLGKWSGGKTPSMAEHDYWDAGKIPWITSKDMKCSTLTDTQDHITEIAVKNAAMTIYPPNSIAIVTRSGILKHSFPVAYIPFSTTVNQDIKILEVNETVIPRYAFHLLQGNGQNILVRAKKQGGTVDSLDFQKLLAYKVPIPPLPVQQRIVTILDRFDTLCNDLTSGLPAEIAARQQQYEYYRDKLLTFEVKAV